MRQLLSQLLNEPIHAPWGKDFLRGLFDERPPMSRPVRNPGAWPRLMQAATAAAYVDERSVDAFRRGVGTLWSKPLMISGKGERWLKEDLDAAIDRATERPHLVRDASDVL